MKQMDGSGISAGSGRNPASDTDDLNAIRPKEIAKVPSDSESASDKNSTYTDRIPGKAQAVPREGGNGIIIMSK